MIGAQTCLDWSRLVHWVSVKSQAGHRNTGRMGRHPRAGPWGPPRRSQEAGPGVETDQHLGGGARLPDARGLVLLASVSQAVLVASVRFSIIH